MVVFLLCIKADLDQVASLSLKPGANLCLSIKNPLSDFEVREKITIDTSEFVEQEPGSREPAHHFHIKWEGSKKKSTMTILSEAEAKSALKKASKKSKSIDLSPRPLGQSGTFVPICAIECRGIEPYKFHCLGNEFIVETEGGAKFEDDVDLSEGDWAEYDEENDLSVSVENFESKLMAV
mmetsp:Transcript_27963/g.43447  ORF Transcript_27963/g.43447 Transcript_27963/m.43447 type:complete len:180 (+) Transcript_27963:69-608(+)|eukprot:CAMPEP_0196821834 /NCGR_PEP_ID=MMETSP1362-20130617/81124_1 /TAXON_ID=163516 /ORGANISM="Leptocylindrus danicus, Strain CCMP1856" /LENGTH=179 /DNA_ID=CAMNT_0042201185 /DNA_START=18 /DNA_END=557 /DNA_ORIENTATION=+